jgi:hypothetical protein
VTLWHVQHHWMGQDTKQQYEDRAREMREHLGFDHTIRAYRLSPSSLEMSCRAFYTYLEYAGKVEGEAGALDLPILDQCWMIHGAITLGLL